MNIDNAGGWQVRIDRPAFDGSLHFYVFKLDGPDANFLRGNGYLDRVRAGEPLVNVKPTFILSGLDGRHMLHALSEALEVEGIKAPSTHKVEGLLEATKSHLEDMRKLVFSRDQ